MERWREEDGPMLQWRWRDDAMKVRRYYDDEAMPYRTLVIAS